MSIVGGTTKQVRSRLLGLVDEALHGSADAERLEPSPGASPDETKGYADALRADAAALQAEAERSREYAEASVAGLWAAHADGGHLQRRGAGGDAHVAHASSPDMSPPDTPGGHRRPNFEGTPDDR
jgi:hypothetical protein